MAVLDVKQSIKELEYYLHTLEYTPEVIADFLNKMSFVEGFVQPLTATNIIHSNRSINEAKGKTFHIAITGSSMQLFYDTTQLQSIQESTEDQTIYFRMLECNIQHLATLKQTISGDSTVTPAIPTKDYLRMLTTHSVTKVSKRKNQAPQVQLSKILKDGELFKQWRGCLYTNDKLVCLKNDQGEYLLVGIPIRDAEKSYEGLTIVTKTNAKSYLAKTGLIGQRMVLQNKSHQDTCLVEAVTELCEQYSTTTTTIYAYQGVYAAVNAKHIKLIMTIAVQPDNIEEKVACLYGAMQYMKYILPANMTYEKVMKTVCVIPEKLQSFLHSEGIEIIKS